MALDRGVRFGMAILAAVVAVSVSAPRPTQAQAPLLGTLSEEYLRTLDLAGLYDGGSFTIRPQLDQAAVDALATSDHPWSEWLAQRNGPTGWSTGARLFVSNNSRHPRGWNDGPLWQGKGSNLAVEATADLWWRGLSVTLNPWLTYNQNALFELAPVSEADLPDVAYPWHRVDLPQRFGDESFSRVDWGQSHIRYERSGVRASFGTQSLWWGPGRRNAIVLSNHAPGFPHLSLGTSRPARIGIGSLEAQWVWGRLSSSEYFDPAMQDVSRFFTGLIVSFSPDFFEGLTIGGTRAFHRLVPDDGLPFGEHFLVFEGVLKSGQADPSNPTGNDTADQLLSFFARWSLPESGFEVYGEWSRNDHAWNLDDFLLEPEHSQAYTLGVQKLNRIGDDQFFLLSTELTHLEAPPTFQVRGRGVYYVHHIVTPGYTHEGQVLGAWVGPGGNSQWLSLALIDPIGRAEVFVQRHVHDNDAFWVWAEANGGDFFDHNVSFDVGGSLTTFQSDFELGLGLTWTREINRYFTNGRVTNWGASLSARWLGGR